MQSKGFTLIELVVVIVILGILAAIAIPKYIDVTDKAKLSADRSQLGTLRSVTHMLYASNILSGTAPDTTNGYWPSESSIWAHLTSTNAWNIYTNVSYAQSNGTWSAQPSE